MPLATLNGHRRCSFAHLAAPHSPTKSKEPAAATLIIARIGRTSERLPEEEEKKHFSFNQQKMQVNEHDYCQ